MDGDTQMDPMAPMPEGEEVIPEAAPAEGEDMGEAM